MYQHVSTVDAVTPVDLDVPGVSIQVLWQDSRTGAMAVVTTMAAGAIIPKHLHTHADESVFVLEGDFVEEGTPYGPGSYFVGAKGTAHGPHLSTRGCRVLTHFSATLDFVLVS